MKYYMDWQKELYDKYPKAMSNCYCGVDYPQEWHDAVKEALDVIELTNHTVSQIKSKFGGLRIYIDGTYESLWKSIAAHMAIRIAEQNVFLIEESLRKYEKRH